MSQARPRSRRYDGHGGQLGGVHRDPVGLDVVGVAVAAELVVGHQHLRPHLADDRDQVVGGLGEVGVPEGVVVARLGGDGVAVLVPLHAGVAVAAEAAEEAVVGHAERRHRRRRARRVRCSPGRPSSSAARCSQVGHQDLAHLAGGAGDQGDAAALGDVLRHRGALADRLVVGVGVDQQQPLLGERAHAAILESAPDGGIAARSEERLHPVRSDRAGGARQRRRLG